jgi:hypothetical protein
MDSQVVGQRVREGGEPAPYRGAAHPLDRGGRKAHRLGREEHDRIVAATFAHQCGEALAEVVRGKQPCPVDHVRRLVDREPLDRQPLHGRFKGEHRAPGVAEHPDRPAERLDHRREIL